MVDKVAIGCDGDVNRIVGELHYDYNVLTDESAGLTIDFSFNSLGVSFNSYEEFEPITDKIISDKYKEDQQRIKEWNNKE